MVTIPDSTPKRKIITFYAQFQGKDGIALRDTQDACWFHETASGELTLLHDCDIPALQLLGRKDLADAQRAIDQRGGRL